LLFAETAPLAQSSVVLPVEWTGADDWRETYMALDDPEALRAAGEARRAAQAVTKP